VKENGSFGNKNITMRSKFVREERKEKLNSQVKVRWLEIGDKWDLIKEDKI
jgi:hypothetical protein